jgi:hypothetical protein
MTVARQVSVSVPEQFEDPARRLTMTGAALPTTIEADTVDGET